MLMRTYRQLLAKERLNETRRRAVAQGLWECIQAAFFLKPGYWSQIAEMAKNIDPKVRPIQEIYDFPFFRNLSPIFIQWLMLPKRLVFYHIRQWLKKFYLRHNL